MLFCIKAFPVYALEPLNFQKKLSKADNYRLQSLLDGHEAASVDLNEDGIEEFILKSTDCNLDTLCKFKVLALKNNDFLNLGEFEAQKVVLTNNYTSGVRNILVYNNLINDYAYATFIWNPKLSRFAERKK